MVLANVSHPVDTLMAYLGSASTAKTTAIGHENTIQSKLTAWTCTTRVLSGGALEPVLPWKIGNCSAMQLVHPHQLVRRLVDFALQCGEAVSECHNTTDT